MERMRKTTTKEEGFAEGVKIAKETYDHVRNEMAGAQLSAPMGRIEGDISDFREVSLTGLALRSQPRWTIDIGSYRLREY